MTTNQPLFTMKAYDGNIIGYEADLTGMMAALMGIELKIILTPFPEPLDA